MTEPNNNVFEGLSQEAMEFVNNKGFKTIEDVVNGYRNYEKYQGVPQEKLLKLPDENNADEVNAFYKKLGRPDKAEDYKFEIAEGQDDAIAKAIAPELFKIGLSQKQAAAIYKTLETAKIEQGKAAEAAAIKAEEDLKSEWGSNYDNNLKAAQQAAKIAGVTPEQIEALQKATDYKTVMNIFKNLASKFGEDVLRGAGDNRQSRFTLTPQQAREKIEQLKSNAEWVAKMNSGDKAALQEYDELAKIAVSDMQG
jgi:hypothetical protein